MTARLRTPQLPAVDAFAVTDESLITALRAVYAGNGSEHQQQLVMNWIVKDLGGIGAQSFRTGDSHGTAFMEGRRFVAQQILAAMTANPNQLRNATNG